MPSYLFSGCPLGKAKHDSGGQRSLAFHQILEHSKLARMWLAWDYFIPNSFSNAFMYNGSFSVPDYTEGPTYLIFDKPIVVHLVSFQFFKRLCVGSKGDRLWMGFDPMEKEWILVSSELYFILIKIFWYKINSFIVHSVVAFNILLQDMNSMISILRASSTDVFCVSAVAVNL